jgi:hypothetical protein
LSGLHAVKAITAKDDNTRRRANMNIVRLIS